MLKVIGALLIIVAGAAAGAGAEANLKKRVAFIESFLAFINETETYIKYSAVPLKELFLSFSYDGIMGELIKSTLISLECGKEFYNAWNMSVASLKASFLLNEDIEMLKNFGVGLGKTDIDGQLSHCHIFMEKAKIQLEAAGKDYTVKSKLYRSLGFLGGSAAALLFI